LGRRKQEFPFRAYSKVVKAIMDGHRSPSELLRRKVLSKRKLHAYLNLFADIGLLIRRRLPKHGNHVVYELNREEVFLADYQPSRNLDAEDQKRAKRAFSREKWYLPLNYQSQKAMSEWRARFVHRRDENAKRLRAELQTHKRTSLYLLKKRHWLEQCGVLRDLAPLQPKSTKDIIQQLESGSLCPNCLSKLNLGAYLRSGLQTVSRLRLVRQENIIYCPDCHEECDA